MGSRNDRCNRPANPGNRNDLQTLPAMHRECHDDGFLRVFPWGRFGRWRKTVARFQQTNPRPFGQEGKVFTFCFPSFFSPPLSVPAILQAAVSPRHSFASKARLEVVPPNPFLVRGTTFHGFPCSLFAAFAGLFRRGGGMPKVTSERNSTLARKGWLPCFRQVRGHGGHRNLGNGGGSRWKNGHLRKNRPFCQCSAKGRRICQTLAKRAVRLVAWRRSRFAPRRIPVPGGGENYAERMRASSSRAKARASGSLAASRPPACALSGFPPPPPPVILATAPTSFPACRPFFTAAGPAER